MRAPVSLSIPNRSVVDPLEDGVLALSDLGRSGQVGSSGLGVSLRHGSSMGYPDVPYLISSSTAIKTSSHGIAFSLSISSHIAPMAYLFFEWTNRLGARVRIHH